MDIQSLRKILQLEIKRGYDDKAVMRGLDIYLDNCAKEIVREGSLPPDLLASFQHLRPDNGTYAAMGKKQRQEWVKRVIVALDDIEAAIPHQKVDSLKTPSIHHSQIVKAAAPKKVVRSVSGDKNFLEAPVTSLKGISQSLASKFSRLGLNTVRDLLYFFPRRHLDYSQIKPISALKPGEEQTIIGSIWEARPIVLGNRRKCTEATVGDDSGNIRVIWFNQPYLAKTFQTNDKIVLSGRVSWYRGWNQMDNPAWEFLKETELIHTGRLVPIYSLTSGLYERQVRRLVKEAVDRWVPLVEDFLPQSIKGSRQLLDLPEALLQAHYPDNLTTKNKARERLAFDELFLLQLGVLSQKSAWQESQPGIALTINKEVLDRFLGGLPFSLTEAQEKVLQEIFLDLGKNKAMSRLLQGEVGSGKTVVAIASLLMAIINGYQGAIMAPTEILAEQHFHSFSQLLSDAGHPLEISGNTTTFDFSLPEPVTVSLLTGSTKGKRGLYKLIAEGKINLVIGTHALIQEGVSFKQLGLAVIDEQHRFGVLQRSALRQKGFNPHILVMTATPIPRTLALTLYGDLDLSTIDELPPGRQKILTKWVAPEKREAAYAFVRQQIEAGRQAFIICPLIEESEALETRAAVEEHKRLSQEVFPDLRVGLLHGKMAAVKKEETMRLFRDGGLDILVSTAVVEVGIDVPNATVMVVEGADRFGLSQLHQFRGRVGRGTEKSYCLLLAEDPSPRGQERLSLVEKTQNGFELADEDLRLRGPGEFFGTRQTGLPDLRMAKLSDVALLEIARREAELLFRLDPSLKLPEYQPLRKEMARVWKVGTEWSSAC